MTELELANIRQYMNQLIIQLNAINRELERVARILEDQQSEKVDAN